MATGSEVQVVAKVVADAMAAQGLKGRRDARAVARGLRAMLAAFPPAPESRDARVRWRLATAADALDPPAKQARP